MEGNTVKQNDEKVVSGASLSRSVAQSEKSRKPAVFFDRDGTLIDDIGYLADPDGISFYPGIPKALRRLQEYGYILVVLTNQSGIGRGYFPEETALKVNLAMVEMLRAEGVNMDGVYYCPHHPDEKCNCRKPDLLMVQRALGNMDIDLNRSWVVGDIDKDIWTGRKSGMRSILVETGKIEKGEVPVDVQRCSTVVEAVEHILKAGAP